MGSLPNTLNCNLDDQGFDFVICLIDDLFSLEFRITNRWSTCRILFPNIKTQHRINLLFYWISSKSRWYQNSLVEHKFLRSVHTFSIHSVYTFFIYTVAPYLCSKCNALWLFILIMSALSKNVLNALFPLCLSEPILNLEESNQKLI